MIITPVQPGAGPMPLAGTMSTELARLGQSFQLQLARLMVDTAQAIQAPSPVPPLHAAPLQTPAFLAECFGATAVSMPPSLSAKAKDKRQKKRPARDDREQQQPERR